MKSLYHRNGRPLDTDPKAGRVCPARMRHLLHGGLALLLTAALAFVPCALAEPGDLPEEPVGSESFPPAEDGYVTVASNSRLELRVAEMETWFQVVDKNGHVWSSTPEKYEEVIERGDMDMVIFFYNPTMINPKEPDVYKIIRTCDQYNIPIATNIGTAESLILGLARGDLDWREQLKAD